MRPKHVYPYEQGEVWATAIGIRYLIVWIDGTRMEVEKQPHKAKPGVKALLYPERKTMQLCDFNRVAVRNVTEERRLAA